VGNIVVGASLASLHQRVLTYVATGVGAALLALVFAYVRILRIRRDVDRTERQLEELIYVDPVSQLLNRRAANQQLEALQRLPSRGFVMALLDLDDFKLVNDTHGHPAGDELLLALGRRLVESLAPGGKVFRYGGDEFLLVFPDSAEAEKDAVGQRILEVLQPLLALEARMMSVRGSVGLAHFPSDASDTSDLLRAADTAMYRAKQSGKNSFASYTPAMDRLLRRRLRLLGELRRALENDEFRLVFQPIVAMEDARIVGVEALVRWHHPELGLVGPNEFIPAAEENGLILDVGDWVLKAACQQVAQWRARDAVRMNDFYVAVNVSAKQLGRGLHEQVRAALAAEALPPQALQIEITEYSVVEAMDANIEQLAALRRFGVKVAIDDFGTGLSSLGYLKRLPIDKLKIDRAFVKDLPGTREDSAIASAIVALAQNLGLEIVAEGVETAPQAAWLKQAGCAFGQGYYFSRPLSAAQLEPWLEGGTAAPAAAFTA
jgi:diguanylate cyclase (GGDEF)-like protein